MRHQNHRSSLGVSREHRESMLSNLAVGLITHGRIQTTLTKAKALRPFVEKIITKAKQAAAASDKKDSVHLRRVALTKVRNDEAVALLFNEKYKEFANRAGGYTRIYKLSDRRVGDAAPMALIELVKADDQGYKKPSKSRKSAKAQAEVAPAAVAETPAPVAPEAPATGEAQS